MDAGTRQRLLEQPVAKPADLKGMKIHMMGDPLFVETMNTMGGNGVAMGFNELFSALQTSIINSTENNPPTLLAQTTYAVSKVYSLTGHLIMPEIFVFSRSAPGRERYGGRPAAAAQAVARGAAADQRQLWDAVASARPDRAEGSGMRFVKNADKRRSTRRRSRSATSTGRSTRRC